MQNVILQLLNVKQKSNQSAVKNCCLKQFLPYLKKCIKKCGISESTMFKTQTKMQFLMYKTAIYLRGKSTPWLNIPAGRNAWFLVLKCTSPRKCRSRYRSERQNWRKPAEGCGSWSCDDTIPFLRRNMQIHTPMHQNDKEQVNHLDAKYIKNDIGSFTIYVQKWLNKIQIKMSTACITAL